MKLSARCYAVAGLGYLPPWTVNAGFVVGDEQTLIIDTGANALSAATIHGYAAAVRPTNRILALNTEKHFDHIGGNAWFQESGIAIYGHSGIRRTDAEFREEMAEFNRAIANPARRALGEERVLFHGAKVTPPSHSLESDTTLSLGACGAEILLTPGHTETNLSVWIPADRVLFAGDCLISRYLPNLDAGGPDDWRQWLTSLDRLESLRPNAVLAGHGPVVTGNDVPRMFTTVRAVLRQSIAAGRSPTA